MSRNKGETKSTLFLDTKLPKIDIKSHVLGKSISFSRAKNNGIAGKQDFNFPFVSKSLMSLLCGPQIWLAAP